jgi:hypothetical protein
VVDDHRFDAELGLELDLLQRLAVGRVGDGDGQLVAAPAQGDHALAVHEPHVDHLVGQVGDIERGQVEHRIAEGFGTEDRQRARLDGAVLQ